MILDSVLSEAGIAGHLSTGINTKATKLIEGWSTDPILLIYIRLFRVYGGDIVGSLRHGLIIVLGDGR
jgi:hypothetical protein